MKNSKIVLVKEGIIDDALVRNVNGEYTPEEAIFYFFSENGDIDGTFTDHQSINLCLYGNKYNKTDFENMNGKKIRITIEVG